MTFIPFPSSLQQPDIFQNCRKRDFLIGTACEKPCCFWWDAPCYECIALPLISSSGLYYQL